MTPSETSTALNSLNDNETFRDLFVASAKIWDAMDFSWNPAEVTSFFESFYMQLNKVREENYHLKVLKFSCNDFEHHIPEFPKTKVNTEIVRSILIGDASLGNSVNFEINYTAIYTNNKAKGISKLRAINLEFVARQFEIKRLSKSSRPDINTIIINQLCKATKSEWDAMPGATFPEQMSSNVSMFYQKLMEAFKKYEYLEFATLQIKNNKAKRQKIQGVEYSADILHCITIESPLWNPVNHFNIHLTRAHRLPQNFDTVFTEIFQIEFKLDSKIIYTLNK